MKLRKLTLGFSTMLFLSTAALLGGCATTGMDRSAKTSNSIQEVDSEIRKLIVHIDTTGSSLDALVRTGNPDVKKSFLTYSHDVEQLEREGNKTLKRIDEMKASSKDYFAEWETQGDTYTNPQIRELSDERRTKLANVYAQVPAAAVGIKGGYLAYLSDLKEIQKFLSNDLTTSGVESISPVIQKSVQDRESLKSSFGPVIEALDNIKSELYSAPKK